MLQLENKWMTNNLAKKSLQSGDFIECANYLRLYIVGFGKLTSSAKNTYNYQVKDEQGTILASGENAYLDKLTTIVKGASPKAKANKESESAKASKNLVDEYQRLEANLKKAILAFSDFQTSHHVTTLQDVQTLQETQRSAKRKEAQEARRSELSMLKRLQTLRKWAKDTKRVALLQSLSDIMLNL